MDKKITSFEEYKIEYQKSIKNPTLFWEEKAHNFKWQKKWKNVLSWDFSVPEIKWFEGGKLNITENCLERHLENKQNQTAITWISNNPNEKNINLICALFKEVCKFANVLKKGVNEKNMSLHAYDSSAIAVLACARIGAVHSVVFAGFSAKSLLTN